MIMILLSRSSSASSGVCVGWWRPPPSPGRPAPWA